MIVCWPALLWVVIILVAEFDDLYAKLKWRVKR